MSKELETAGTIVDTPLSEALSSRYLSYALSTIMSRSLPDVRDGLKPVHRRLLYAMHELRLNPKSSYKKSARVVGDVMGKFHPHGDQAIYDTLVRLAQDFSVRYPLIDGQGNFGNIDGDNAAAMRYTEARLTEVAEALLEGIEAGAVDFKETYDGESKEPLILPGKFPNVLANGAVGIAVGMATSIPPHNADELCDGLIAMIENPDITVKELLQHIPGPDFPTGGVIVEDPANILNAYETGRGSFRVRAKWEVEEFKVGQYQIVITEIPFQVAKAKLIEKIADLLNAKKIAMLADVRDESSKDLRLILEPKSRNVKPEVLMEALFKQTDLENRISLNLNVLDGQNIPRVMSLKEVLRAWLDYRREVLIRCSKYRLNVIENRLEILDGLLIAHLNIDEVIKIIRNEDNPKTIMMKKWNLTEVQVEAILNMRLRSLRKLEEIEIKKEHQNLSVEKSDLEALVASTRRQWTAIKKEIGEIKTKFGKETEIGRRYSSFAEAPKNVVISTEAFVEREPVTIICSAKGWIRALKGHVSDTSDVKYKEGDKERFILPAYTTDKLLVFATNGRFYTVGVDKLPGGRGFGEPIRLMVELGNQDDICSLIVSKSQKGPEEVTKLLVVSDEGRGFFVEEKNVIAQTKGGKQVLNLAEGYKALKCIKADGDHVAVIGENRRLLLFPQTEVPEMSRGRGVIFQKYKTCRLSDVKMLNLEYGLQWKSGSKQRTETDVRLWLGKRAQAGRLPPVGFPKSNKFE